jgi:hypothetical protein
MRERDQPDEILEEEDITLSLPRRLGLSEVVRLQIQRFETEVKHRRNQLPSQVEDLVRLVNKRPDAQEIFTEAGRRVARRFWSERSPGLRRLVNRSPRPLALLAAQRAGRRMMAALVGPARFKLTARPLTLRIEGTLTARADPTGAACAIYTGAFLELLEAYTRNPYRVLHASCEGRHPDTPCVWVVEP